MVQQEWKIPVLVEHIVWDEKPQFNLRPLFVPYPVVVQPRYQDAVLLFQRDIRRQLLNWQVNRDNLDDLLWYLFNPQREEKTIHYYFQQGSIHQKITYLAIFFQVRNLPVVLLPAMDNTLLLLPADEKQWEPYIHQQVHQYLWGLMQQEGNDFSWGRWEARRKDFITEIPIKVDLEFSPNRFQEEEVPNWLSQLLAPQRFEGQAELYKVGTHLNERYPHQLQRAFLREEWVEKIHHLIFRATPVPLVLVGEEGVGRHTLLEEALYRYLEALAGDEEETPSSVWLVDPARIIAGMSVVGYWEKRLEAIIAYLRKTSHKQVLAHKMVVDNPVALLRIGRSASGKMTLSDAIKPYLEKRQLPLILLATPSEWDLMQEQDRGFCDLFQVVRIPEPDPTTAVRIVLEQRKQLETKQGVTIDISAISQLFFIHRNYLQKQALPGSVIRLLQQLCSKHRSGRIDALVVRDSFSLSSSLQEHIFDPNYLFEEDEAYQYLTRYIVGQEEAVRALADVVNLYKARLQNPTRPISSLLFIGPTGVGKTQAAKVLATYLLGQEEHLLRFDMNEYVDPYAIYRLLGDGQHEGQLTGKVRYQPFAVVLFDEIEKAHPSVLDLLLQILDEGRLTDALGRPVDFTNTVIILTSNAGADDIKRRIQINPQEATATLQAYQAALVKSFRPEFINRIDKVVPFRQLQPEHIFGIAQIIIKDLLHRDGFLRRTTIVHIEPMALQWIAQRGYDPRMGGRALRRRIEQDLTTFSADQLLRFSPQHPIILGIHLAEEQLKTKIQPLTLTPPLAPKRLPVIPAPNQTGKAYSGLARYLEELIEQVNIWEEETNPEKDWLYFDFTTRLQETLQEVRTISLAHSDPYYRGGVYNTLRLRPARPLREGNQLLQSSSADGEPPAGIFQESLLQAISEDFRFAPPLFESATSEFANHYLNATLLRLFSRGFFEGESERIQLRITPLTNGTGQAEASYLLRHYHQMLTYFDISCQVSSQTNTLQAEAYSLIDLFQGEVGIHLFFLGHRNPLPIQVTLEPEDGPLLNHPAVVRLYDGQKTLTDLRTQVTAPLDLTEMEFKYLLLAGADHPQW